ncbi:MAG: hypothetical protein ACI825_001574 [Planctomycetota bacterium]|jgi:hypothetical protein
MSVSLSQISRKNTIYLQLKLKEMLANCKEIDI